MFSVAQKRQIANEVQRILRDTNHPELPQGEIQFFLHVDGAAAWSWADIRNNGAVLDPGINPWNEAQATRPCQSQPICQKIVDSVDAVYSTRAKAASVLRIVAENWSNTSNPEIQLKTIADQLEGLK
jgi:hypothetical protein